MPRARLVSRRTADGAGTDGLLRHRLRGEGLLGFREDIGLEVSGDRVVLEATDRHLNQHGTVHGGVLATMIDVAMGAAVAASSDGAPVTVALTVTYLEPGQLGRLAAVARVRKRGKRLTVVEAEVQQNGDVIADALATFATPGG